MNPYLFAIFSLKETTTLYVTFKTVSGNFAEDHHVGLNLEGKLKISMIQLLKTLLSLEGNGKGRFLHLFLLHLLRTYILQIPQGIHKEYTRTDSYNNSYPTSTFHELETGDGCIISCRRWNCSHSRLKFNEEKHPVLLLNGHSTESFCLPTEPNDLIRTLLTEGHEIWLLQPRLHPLNPSNNFTIEDIGRYDIPAVISKICEFHGPSMKVHVVAHCVGGLAIHIAVMGGHVSPTQIASLCCTNSSMFFKLSTLATVKMWLPLVSPNQPADINGFARQEQNPASLRHLKGQFETPAPNSCKEVFPYIVSHLRLCEEGKDIVMINKEKKDGKEALDWAADPYHGYGGSESCLFSPLLVLFLVLLLVFMVAELLVLWWLALQPEALQEVFLANVLPSYVSSITMSADRSVLGPLVQSSTAQAIQLDPSVSATWFVDSEATHHVTNESQAFSAG
ncbi:hypothetical protein PVK06_003995 [Gossypium arboreum]|uniref:AB hydrolase-1 domain-containing protein n=1 Tax=Gossypium arboreum TaxID=29729 RepID=A0ABR0QQR1_GOSAR|nr:hypothetical protein PVK06_003995 [Gossypium arboreum]